MSPLAKYDRFYGGRGGAAKAHAAMVQQYGERADEAFYRTVNKKKKRKALTHGAKHGR